MGAYSPAPLVTTALEKDIMQQVVKPLMKGLKRERMNYRGVNMWA